MNRNKIVKCVAVAIKNNELVLQNDKRRTVILNIREEEKMMTLKRKPGL